MNTRFTSLFQAAALAVTVSVAIPAQADPVLFVLDPNQSTLTLSGAAFGLPVGAQSGHAGSLTAHWGGTISANLSGGVLTFTGGSAINALLNTAANPPFSTTPNPGTAGIDNYGVFGSGLVTGVGLVLGLNGAYRSLTLDITSGTITSGSSPAGLTLGFTSGYLDWGAIVSPNTPFGGTSTMVGVNATDTAAGLALFDGTTLTLPIQLHTLGSNRFEDWNGTLVAVIPEPSSVAFAVLGCGLLAASRRWRRQ